MMSDEEFRYRMSLSAARTMLEEGIISKEEFSEIDAVLLEKHRPVVSTLLAGKPL